MSIITFSTPYGAVGINRSTGESIYAVSDKEAREYLEGGEDDDKGVSLERYSKGDPR